MKNFKGSEPLTLEEEHKMQRSWLEDEDKLTFIVLSRELYDDGIPQIACMVGDVNLFINWEERNAEVEVMIAEPSARRKGIALEAVSLIISYGIRKFNLLKFTAKIVEDNEATSDHCPNIDPQKQNF
ncbi:unnamed protein product [Caenorhabditis auriculariae]|uniref:N-acetyltransferase domain-containing protein n=1 Tax=Caenorhabditis auriculariae TaxID=2777116 RepID=A0A8S1GXZ7_9PELO|nr:unnamed protein product [Caenorhabditis auriculariae]